MASPASTTEATVRTTVTTLAAAPSNLATTIRLMAGHELVTEGFAEGQVGSSAMPHKMNTRSCERVNGLAVVLRGHLSMVSELAGDQWNEGDVSCSVVRRVALPDAFFAADGLFQTFLTVLDEFGAFPAVIQRELDRYLPFLATTKVLMAAVRNGVGREAAHEAIKEHAVAVALEMRQGRADNDLFDRLAADPRLGLDRAAIAALVREPIEFTGAARSQTQAVVRRVEARGRPPPRRRGVHPRRDPLTLASAAEQPVQLGLEPRDVRPWSRSSSGRRSTTIVPPGSSLQLGRRPRSCRRSAGAARPPCRPAARPRGASLAVSQTCRGPARSSCPSSSRRDLRQGRTTCTRNALAAIRTAAPISPPSSELSGPITAFCTTFDSSSTTIRSKELSCARSRLPASRSSTISAR